MTLNLAHPIVPESTWHPNFRAMVLQGNGYSWDVLNDWARGFYDRDGKFVKEFQTTFNSSFWELYVFAVLKKYGLPVDFSHARPDFLIPAPGFTIEAAIASHAEGADPEYARAGKLPLEDTNELDRRIIVRLSNAIRSKHQKFVDHYYTLEHVRGKPFVLAVAAFDQPYGWLAAQRPIEAVLLGRYVDEDKYVAEGRPGGKPQDEFVSHVPKDNGAPIQMGMFDGNAFPELSAVIFSNCATMGKIRALSADPCTGSIFAACRLNPHSDRPHVIQEPKSHYSEQLVDGLRVYHNPFATYPLDPAIFRHPRVFQIYLQNGKIEVEQREGLLLARFMQPAAAVPDGELPP